MTQIYANEIDRGFVLHLCPTTLLAYGARVHTPEPSNAVIDKHFFLCLGADASEGDWLPLFSDRTPGRMEIPASMKSGHPKWTEGSSYYYPNQIWSVSHRGAVAAAIAVGDMSTPDLRNLVLEEGIPDI